MKRLVTVEVKGNEDDATRKTLYTKRDFLPWNIMMGRGSLSVSSLGIGNKGCITTDIFSNPKLRNQTALSKYFRNLKNQGLTPTPPK